MQQPIVRFHNLRDIVQIIDDEDFLGWPGELNLPEIKATEYIKQASAFTFLQTHLAAIPLADR